MKRELQELQEQVNEWMDICIGTELSNDKTERNHLFLKESLELVQSLGCARSEAHQIVDYVFNRPPGLPSQACGDVMIAIAALATATSLNMSDAGPEEVQRKWENKIQLQKKHPGKSKPFLLAPLNCRVSITYKREQQMTS